MEIKNRKASYDYFIDKEIEAGIVLTGTEIKSLRKGSANIKDSITLYDLLKRTEITIQKLKDLNIISDNYDEEVMEQVEIFIKYSGYINKVEKEAAKMLKQEEKQIPKDINYSEIPNLASEARQKLERVNPETIGQALRISGVNPADISILLIYLRKKYHE